MDNLKKSRAAIKGQLTRFTNYIAGNPENELEIRMRLNIVESLFEKFETVQTEIENLLSDANAEAESVEREQFENHYYSSIANAQEILKRFAAPPLIEANNSIHSGTTGNLNGIGINLPKIDLPKFDGSYGAWVKFRDTFKNMIHDNTRLSNIQKFHYLNSVLSGEALHAVENLGISDANYELAWTALTSRYEDANALLHHHVQHLFEYPALGKSESYKELRHLLDTSNTHLLALKALGEKTEYWDALIIYLLNSKLNYSIKREWEKSLTSHGEGKITLKIMTDFLEKHCRYLQRANVDKITTSEQAHGKPNAKSNSKQLKSYATTTKTCALCNGAHAIYACKQFKSLNPSARLQKAQELHLCFNCLSDKHQNKECDFGPCKKCGKKHNNLLHLDRTVADHSQSENSKSVVASGTSKAVTQDPSSESALKTYHAYSKVSSNEDSEYVLLATAVVNVFDKTGKSHECRVLLDPCSQAHIMTTELRKRLNVPLKRITVDLTGIEGGSRSITSCASVKLQSRTNQFSTSISCLVMDEISSDLPSREMSNAKIQVPNNIILADPQYNYSRPVDLLIGASLYYELECNGMIQLQRDQPFFKKTLLGWIVAGRVHLPRESKKRVVCNLIRNEKLNAQLSKFWTIENCFSEMPRINENDFCERHFRETTQRDEDGRFIVSIPFKDDINKLGQSKELAHKQLLGIEKSLKRNDEQKNDYIEFMHEYEQLGHMTEITVNQTDRDVASCYLPHHIVTKEGSTTTKRRVVFNGSKKTVHLDGTTAPSLNDIQHVGPTVQDDLFSIVIRFRQHNYVMTADIAKMYRQILIKPEERNFQRILWRSDFNTPVKIFQLNTVTYGTASAPFLATRCLVQLAIDHEQRYPSASKVLRQDFYVDDMLTGVNTIEEGQALKAEISDVLKSAGMDLRKWASNEPRVLQQSNANADSIPIQGDKDPKTLGLFWDPQSDQLKYKVNLHDIRRVTKRTILSIIAQIFDPLGLVGPAIVQAKLIMQRLWSLQLGWDETVPQELNSSWNRIYAQLNDINDIIANRQVNIRGYQEMHLHGFCDASDVAYGACIYVCSTDAHGRRESNLLCAKSRVAPLKATSTPRLELLGALLLAQLAHKVSIACNLKKENWTFWSDSMVALAWIKSPSNRWKPFVANRVAEIQDLTNESWHHVESQMNPADIISRGVNARELQESDLWWHGPSWLLKKQTAWPMTPELRSDTTLEERKSVQVFVTQHDKETINQLELSKSVSTFMSNLINEKSSFSLLIRSIAYLKLFIDNIRTRLAKKELRNERRINTDLTSFSLSSKQLHTATHLVIKWAQTESYATEINQLKRDNVPPKNKLLRLSPFIDDEGLLRVGGRLRNATYLSFNKKHPLLLAPKHQLTDMLIRYEHTRLLHAGCQATLASLREKYWIVDGKNAVKKILLQCVTCFRANPTTQTCMMGDLPDSRLIPTRPFYNCGVDYAGPFLLKEKSRSKITTKAYICIFVCFVTKAVDIELASDLSTKAFMNCLTRFVCRHGICKNIYSDNGTNFVGAKNELKEIRQFLNSNNFRNRITSHALSEQIDWHFIPPRAPHFGGLWESAVKSAKYHLKRVIGETRLTYEEFNTILTQVEACLNSRPLSPISNDPNDLTPLTPGHFLIGDSLKALPQKDVQNIPDNRLTRYELMQKLFQHFWARWNREYLPQLQQRQKWIRGSPMLERDTMVLIKEDNIPPMQWPLGRIVETHPGKDGHIRVVSIQTAKGIVKRPTTKICILPIQSSDERRPED